MSERDPRQPARAGLRIGVATGLFVLLALYVATHFQLSADVTGFLPDDEGRDQARLARQLAESELSRTLILAIETPDLETSLAASRAFEDALRRDPRITSAIAFLEAGPIEGLEEAVFALYSPRRLAFLAPSPDAARARLTEAGLEAAARTLRAELAGPLSTMLAPIARSDPFLTLPGLFRRLETARGGDLSIREGRFVTADGRTAMLFLGTKASALDSKAQAPILAAIDEAFAGVAAGIDAPIRLDQSGLHRVATRTALTIEADIQRVSIASSLLAAIFLLVLFRSLRFVALAAIPVGFGVLTGAGSVLLVVGRLHGITLAFGAALIGVSIDYVVHLYCHHTIVRPEGGASASLRAILGPLSTGAITTVAGFLVLSASSLAGLREITLFSVTGLAAAFAVSVLVVPVSMGPRGRGIAASPAWVEGIQGVLRALARRRGLLIGLPAAALAIVAVGAPRVALNPDLASLANPAPDLVAESERVQAKMRAFEQGRLVVALGDDDDEALVVNDLVAARLGDAIGAGELGAIRSIAPLLPAPSHQRAILDIARGLSAHRDRFERIFADAGFAPGVFDPFFEELERADATPLEYADFGSSPAASLVRPFRVHLGDRVAYLTFLSDARDPEALADRLADLSGAVFLDQGRLWRDATTAYQRSTARLLAGGLLAVLALLALRYRDVRRTVVAFAPSLLAAATTVSVLALAGRGLDLISLTALLFVVSMGVDYSVFLIDASDEPDPRSVAAAMTGALLAGASTVAAFGLLSLSDHPVLSGLGMTAAIGIGTSLVLAPTTLLLLRPDQTIRAGKARP